MKVFISVCIVIGVLVLVGGFAWLLLDADRQHQKLNSGGLVLKANPPLYIRYSGDTITLYVDTARYLGETP